MILFIRIKQTSLPKKTLYTIHHIHPVPNMELAKHDYGEN